MGISPIAIFLVVSVLNVVSFALSLNYRAIKARTGALRPVPRLCMSEVSDGSDSAGDAQIEKDVASIESLNRMQAKLKEEVDNPFRKVRQFVYIAVGLAGLIGAVTTMPSIVLVSQGADGDMQTNLINLGIDVAGVVSAAIFWNKDASDEARKVEMMLAKERAGAYQMDSSEAIARAIEVANMPVQIQVNEQNGDETKIVRFGDLQSKGGQNIIVVAGRGEYVKEQVMTARLEGNDLFNSCETYVVPVIVDADVEATSSPQLDAVEALQKKGFGKTEELMAAPYIGKPAQLNVWLAYLAKEIELAKKQGEPDIVNKGVVLGVRKDGKIVRRGVGAVPWRQLVKELDADVEAKT